jgi:hypothetical protein
MEWCPAIVVSGIRIRTLPDNHPGSFDMCVVRRHVQWSLAVGVPNIHINGMRE